MFATKTSSAAGVLLGSTSILGLLILVFDSFLWSLAPIHAHGLMGFLVIDFGVAGILFARPTRLTFTLATAWATLRILIQMGDLFLAPTSGMAYSEFANYLFNPLLVVRPNPAGAPGALIDHIPDHSSMGRMEGTKIRLEIVRLTGQFQGLRIEC